MRRSLRLRPGDRVTLCDGAGTDYDGTLLRYEEETAVLAAEAPRPSPGEPATRVTLYQGIARGDRMDYAVQKAVELGVFAVVPVLMRRCTARAEKPERLRRIAFEAAKQSGRGRVPEVSEALPFAEAGRVFAAHAVRLVPYEAGGVSPARALEGLSRGADLGIWIGPEGGFEPEELAALTGAGATAVTLGPRVLRTETAGPVTLALVMERLGEMEP